MNLEMDRDLTENSFWRYASNAMNLPGPFDFGDADVVADVPKGESANRDLLQNFHSTEYRGLKRDPVQRKRDRRLNLMRHCCENDSDGEGTESCGASRKRLGSNSNLKFLGEQLVSGQNLINDTP